MVSSSFLLCLALVTVPILSSIVTDWSHGSAFIRGLSLQCVQAANQRKLCPMDNGEWHGHCINCSSIEHCYMLRFLTGPIVPCSRETLVIFLNNCMYEGSFILLYYYFETRDHITTELLYSCQLIITHII